MNRLECLANTMKELNFSEMMIIANDLSKFQLIEEIKNSEEVLQTWGECLSGPYEIAERLTDWAENHLQYIERLEKQ